MNKKELSEIKTNFSDDSGLFTVNQVVTAFVDAEKNIKCKSNRFYLTIPQEESECLMTTLKKVLSGSLGKGLLEYSFPNEMYEDDGAQKILYTALRSKLKVDADVDAVLDRIVGKMEYLSTYAIMMAHCTYNVFSKNKNDDEGEEAELEYSFIVTAICPVELRVDGLIYDEDSNEIARKSSFDRIVAETPSDGFLFPVFNDRAPDINHVLYYTHTPKKPNISVVNEVLGCEFVFSAQDERETFETILSNVVGDELDYNVITTVNEKIREVVDNGRLDSELPVIDSIKLRDILIDSGVSDEKISALPKVFETTTGNKPLTASNLVQPKTVVSLPSITINISKDAVDKVRTRVIDGAKCLVIDLDDPSISINGLNTSIK